MSTVHIAVVEPWDAANAWFYEQEDSWFDIDMPEAASPGDFVLMVTHGRGGAAILGGGFLSDDTGPSDFVLDEPLAIDMPMPAAVVNARLTDLHVNLSPQTIVAESARLLLDAVTEEQNNPTPWREVDQLRGDCGERVSLNTAMRSDDWSPIATMCGICHLSGRQGPSTSIGQLLEIHYETREDREVSFWWDPRLPVCATCHALLHSPLPYPVLDLAHARRPPCPKCKAYRTDVVWGGMIVERVPPGIAETGCALPMIGDAPAEFYCRECRTFWRNEPVT